MAVWFRWGRGVLRGWGHGTPRGHDDHHSCRTARGGCLRSGAEVVGSGAHGHAVVPGARGDSRGGEAHGTVKFLAGNQRSQGYLPCCPDNGGGWWYPVRCRGIALGTKKWLARCVWVRVDGITSGCRRAAEPFQLHVWHVYGLFMAGEGISLVAVGFLSMSTLKSILCTGGLSHRYTA